MPVVCVRQDEEGLCYDVLTSVGWQRSAAAALPRATPLASTVLLIPDHDCYFRHRHFPLDMLAAGDLDEAVMLDIEQWSPFIAGKAITRFFLAERRGEAWHVAVWIWVEETAARLLARLPAGVQCTHIMPEMAWHVAQLPCTAPALLIIRSTGYYGYALVSAAGVPCAIAWPRDAVAARRFWRGLGAEAHQVEQAWSYGDEVAAAWRPHGVQATVLPAVPPRHAILSHARMEGVHDWSDPFTWRRQAAALCALFLIWALADASVLVQRGGQLKRTLIATQKSAHDVLQQRDLVDHLQLRLQRFAALRRAQQRPERLLAALSRSIPDDIWLDVVQVDRAWIDLNGRGKNVVRLIVLLEKMPGVKQAMLLNDIRPDARTGLESFQLRLVLD